MSTDVYSLFNADERKKADKVEAKKLKALSKRLGQLGLAGLEDSHIKPTLMSREPSEGADRERDLLSIYEDSLDGTLYPFDPTCHLLGAVNRQSVTCYLDTILFAMFARVPTFEAILYKTFEDQSRQKLATLLRLWVNLLRRGLLITAAIVRLQHHRTNASDLLTVICRPNRFKKPSRTVGGRRRQISANRMLRKPSPSSPKHSTFPISP